MITDKAPGGVYHSDALGGSPRRSHGSGQSGGYQEQAADLIYRQTRTNPPSAPPPSNHQDRGAHHHRGHVAEQRARRVYSIWTRICVLRAPEKSTEIQWGIAATD
ncbi:hypothetical protein B0H17DRAFT_318520 [Mycena rosella]|uniref:Uncharacterized protein n=1 Tax=Mycena rosella TaxID=1033263 RepID=A0AAD7CSW6_MYCRO|nr:hypothetical protein B0H17DRAFT_318520 [Mycena rosella]